jgi:amino acid transporter
MRKNDVKMFALLAVAATVLLSTPASAFDPYGEMKSLLKSVGAGMALVLLAYYGINWITSETPEARAEVKNSIKWILIGLLVLSMACYLVCGILGYAAQTYYGITVSCICS